MFEVVGARMIPQFLGGCSGDKMGFGYYLRVDPSVT